MEFEFTTTDRLMTDKQLANHRRLSRERIEALTDQKQHMDARKAELAPLVGALMFDASIVYDTLRPNAQHISEATMDFPLKHQQISLHKDSVSTSDQLMIQLPNTNSLTITQLSPEDDWHLNMIHSRHMGPLTTDQTILEELGGRDISFNTGVFQYSKLWSRKTYFVDEPCSYFNNYAGAEERIEIISTDLQSAVNLYS